MSTEHVFATNLHVVRGLRGMTLAQLAGALTDRGFKTDQSLLSRIERGGREVKIGEAVVISQVLGVALSDMVDPEGRIYRAGARMEEMQASIASTRQELASQILGGAS